MAISLADQYYLKAMDFYPYNMEDAIESLNYALSYDGDHAGANYLMGKLYMEQFHKFDVAEEYFMAALGSDPYLVKACESYAWLLLRMQKHQRALKLLQYAKGLVGANRPKLLRVEALVYESLQDYPQARVLLNQAMQECYSSGFISLLEDELQRVMKKEGNTRNVNYELNG